MWPRHWDLRFRVWHRSSVFVTSLVAGAGNRELARCDGGDISWQAQYFVRVRRVDAERFVAGAGNREVVSCGTITSFPLKNL